MKEKYIVHYRYEKNGKLKFKFFNDFEKAYRFYKQTYLDFYDTHLTYVVRII